MKDYLEELVTLPTLGVEEFRRTYLPLLLKPDPAEFNKQWIHGPAKNPFVKVVLVDSKGEPVITVPGLRDHLPIQTDTRLQQQLGMVSAIEESNKLRSANLLASSLAGKGKFDSIPSGDNRKEWIKLLEFFGYENLVAVDPSTEPEPNVVFEEDEEW